MTRLESRLPVDAFDKRTVGPKQLYICHIVTLWLGERERNSDAFAPFLSFWLVVGYRDIFLRSLFVSLALDRHES